MSVEELHGALELDYARVKRTAAALAREGFVVYDCNKILLSD
jgi:hypothetical protein